MRPLRSSDPELIGPYRLFAELGRGALGRLLLAGAPNERLVAIKRMRADFVEEDGFRARFRREVDACRAVTGAHTAAVLDADAEAPVPWLASEFVPGVSLREAVDVVGPLPEDKVLRLAAGLSTALTGIHRVGVVHRNFKPSNVILSADGLKVTDFGVARATESEGGGDLTHIDWLVGASGFMSPEQAEGRRPTARSDVFSLGAVLVAASTGKGPFAGPSAPQTLYNVMHTEPDLGALSERLREIVEPCLAKNPLRRPTPSQLLESLGRIDRSAQPWPPAVHTLIAKRQAEVTRLVEVPRESVSGRTAHPSEPAAADARGRGAARRAARLGALIGLPALLASVLVGTLLPATDGSGSGGRSTSASPSKSAPVPAAALAAKLTTTFFGHTGYVTDVAFSPDGRMLASGSSDGTARLWSMASRRQVGRPMTAGSLDIDSVDFSPDGRTLATGSSDGTARLWSVADQRQIGRPMTIGSDPVNSVDFSPDGRTLATGGDDGTARLWSVADQRQIGRPIQHLPNINVLSLAFSPDGRTLATGDGDGRTRLWDVASRRQIGQPFGRSLMVDSLAFSPDGAILATGNWDHTTVVWDVASHRQLAKLVGTNTVMRIAFSPDGRILATADIFHLWLWDVAGHRRLGEIQSGAVDGPSSVAFSPDGHSVAIGGGDDNGTVQVWDVRPVTGRLGAAKSGEAQVFHGGPRLDD
ncbi:serine/threonine protein kinase [Streptomyces sp. NBC_01728]|uniref:WD40 repeat domain-containing serine/threonine protein kinase n=1 Tax=unclassified Streptomyces TaxID=2593676 RepID=UPI00225999DD|nr:MULTISPECIES: serine/threonine-protein kinase [unclassified Streptomyces]MCX4452892.1 serine/threonine protein kinase [Streptomyces sp. NBC_01719]MCX4492252.1 serine/threonine protein kinase [Streptomyces sp. NBC_01728]